MTNAVLAPRFQRRTTMSVVYTDLRLAWSLRLQGSHTRRRDFIVALGGGWWPFVAHAQQGQPMRRISLLMVYHKSDREGHLRAVVFQQELEKLGWTIDGNLQVDYYWGVDDYDWARSAVAELLKSAPDVIVANGSPAIKAVQESSRTPRARKIRSKWSTAASILSIALSSAFW